MQNRSGHAAFLPRLVVDNSSSETEIPRRSQARNSGTYVQAGKPRRLQLLTAFEVVPNSAAVGPLPPSASMMSPSFMSRDYPPFVEKVKPTNREVRQSTARAKIAPMQRRTIIDQAEPESGSAIAERLKLTRYALGFGDDRQKAFAEAANVNPKQYSMWESGYRPLTGDGAIQLCRSFGKLSLDWLFFGDASNLPFDVAEEIRAEYEREKARPAAPRPGRGRPRKRPKPPTKNTATG